MLCRWVLKRIRRYRYITWHFCDARLEGRNDLGKGDASRIVPPRLATLLAACAASAELSLYVDPNHGKPTIAKGTEKKLLMSFSRMNNPLSFCVSHSLTR